MAPDALVEHRALILVSLNGTWYDYLQFQRRKITCLGQHIRDELTTCNRQGKVNDHGTTATGKRYQRDVQEGRVSLTL